MASTEHQKRHFSSTHWSVILAARDINTAESDRALERMCKAYWYPIYAFIRREGKGKEEARDLTQDFFTLLLERRLFAEADQLRGKFRTFLLKALKNFLKDQHRRDHAIKRGGGQTHFSLDAEDAESRYAMEPKHEETPEKLYERKWAKAVLAQVMEQLKLEYVKADQLERFNAFVHYLGGSRDSDTHLETARKLEMTETAFRTAFHRFKQRYLQVFRHEVTQLVSESKNVEDEIKHIMTSMKG